MTQDTPQTVQQLFTQDELWFMKSLVSDYLSDWDDDSEVGLSVYGKLKQLCID